MAKTVACRRIELTLAIPILATSGCWYGTHMLEHEREIEAIR
jgi:hypothetical protein